MHASLCINKLTNLPYAWANDLAAAARVPPSSSALVWPYARFLQLLHGLVGELRPRCIAANHEHQNCLLISIALGNILEAADSARRKRNHVQRIKVEHLGGGVRCDGWPPGPAPEHSLLELSCRP
jgi:hypothetical protein